MYNINSDGLLVGSRFAASPHCDDRPLGMAIDLLVIHNISLPSGVFGGGDVEDLFMGRLQVDKHSSYADIAQLRVSAHLFIRRSGEVIQFVPFHLRAWHAGQSNFHGRSACNDFSIGIELEGSDVLPFESIQYQQLAHITRMLMKIYPGITPKTIVGHSDIAPNRKTDPGPYFDWTHYYGLMHILK